jgi:Ca2+-binding RTX toxin-like protein
VTAQKANQTITVTQAAPANAVYGTTFTVAANASTGLAVAISAAGAASGSGSGTATITIISATGTGTITFSQAGNANYASATGTVTVQVIGPGVSVVGTELWYVGTPTTVGNDQVVVSPAGTSNTGSSGIVVNGTTYNQSFTALRIYGFDGNDKIQISNSLMISTFITEGNGNVSIQAGNNDNTITLGNGNNNVLLGNGNNVIVTGNGHDNIQAGDGNNLIVAGLGKHNVQVGNGRNILIDGSVQLTQSGDSLNQVLNDWVLYGNSAANVASIRNRLAVTYNNSNANTLNAGTGLDWFWYTYAKDSTNRKATDLLN